MHLMNTLVCLKERRLSCKSYRENESRGRQAPTRRKSKISPTAYFVHENDAEDIKQHPFFEGISWSNLHLTRPPFVPRILGDQPITKYFESENEILGSSGDRAPEASKKRARDKILRDPGTGRVAMVLRKESAFEGYEYRRPHFEQDRSMGEA